jgi:prevent-host-death family protein
MRWTIVRKKLYMLLQKEPAMRPTEISYSTRDLSRKSGDVIAEALRRPVTITQRNKPRLMLLNIQDYEMLVE